MELYETVANYLKDGQKGILVTVIYRAGSSPREAGAKMFVGEDRRTYGTVGGGRLEAQAYEEALTMMDEKGVKILHIRMDGRAVEGDAMLCGGNVDILLEPVLERHIEVYRRVAYLGRRGRKGLVVTRIKEGEYSKTLIEENLETSGDGLSKQDVERFSPYVNEKGPVEVDGYLLEPIKTLSVLYIFGAGHVSQFLSKVAKMVDFHVVIIDDRAEFANRERFPEADELVVEDFHRVFDTLKFTGEEFVAIITRGHKYDAHVLFEVLKRPTRYIGMIGSKRKVRIVLDHMRQSGFSEEQLEKVHAPIGIDIKAETPQEIAISIVAELIKVRGE
ncbi:MAG: XdhC family protein [Syntrophorhabdaceae bacterium]|nr:XdhC family protein [Syntrophorhabdaceae bacterium]